MDQIEALVLQLCRKKKWTDYKLYFDYLFISNHNQHQSCYSEGTSDVSVGLSVVDRNINKISSYSPRLFTVVLPVIQIGINHAFVPDLVIHGVYMSAYLVLRESSVRGQGHGNDM